MTTVTNKYNFVFCDIALGNTLIALSSEMALTYSEMDTLCGVPDGTVSRLINKPSDNIKMQTLLTVCNGLDIDPRDYFELETK